MNMYSAIAICGVWIGIGMIGLGKYSKMDYVVFWGMVTTAGLAKFL